ncbi:MULTISPECIES: dihydrolipoamide acetyltransferase family protein [unclassified Streptomyces]|uniref:dihydrolipoamide acetyltransferase family protein n=1 Tax=unclassified Streptomyces TaxID=2593676 RepID=UPI001660FF2A|nr:MULTISPECIES: dihydrolipoamide acetyltransferase family protein [unclassified Streptomyces]MBD0708368.1 branched-chain alpha-keto acid dehydrogenase subunit E2 [Streptomyces sp. CBMA291]MBD0708931.1 branched-chain alpha-keto acid dehydrogenase subunit E2 [Streptomyces sp. CBMA291]MBD0716412.1 branched-chain alpha-keto acid dehydrogenase subunit E2 [Streptomyces sp. CBMA370]
MATVLEFKLPDLGEGLTEAEIVRWLVAVGDVVAVDQPVVEVETAKAMVEVPCPYGGVVTARYGEEGTELPVGAPLLTVAVGGGGTTPNSGAGTGAVAGADPAFGAGAGAGTASLSGTGTSPGPVSGGGAGSGGGSVPVAAPARTAAETAVSSEYSGNVLVGYGTAGPAARRRRVRPENPAVARTSARTSAPTAPATAAAPVAVAVAGTGPVPVISPLVRKLARDHGLDLREVQGSGPEGLILRADVEQALAAPAAPPAPATAPVGTPVGGVAGAPAAASAAARVGERIPLRGVRGAVAEKLSRSRTEIPDATCWVDADATELMGARAAMNAAGGPKIALLALLARICAHSLARFPELNATVDTAAREIVRLPDVHLGFAAQTPRGLVVPVVRDAGSRTAESLTAEFARLTEAARDSALTPADLTGGTFTLNNYGVFGVDGSTPIINHPEAAMLGVGRIIPKPWVHQGELAVRQVVQLSLTFDHRVCDGGTAGGFLRYVADCVEQPAVLLRTL